MAALLGIEIMQQISSVFPVNVLIYTINTFSQYSREHCVAYMRSGSQNLLQIGAICIMSECYNPLCNAYCVLVTYLSILNAFPPRKKRTFYPLLENISAKCRLLYTQLFFDNWALFCKMLTALHPAVLW